MPQKNKIKKIALLLNGLHGGGAERVMLILANYWAQKGIQVDFLLGKMEGPYQDLLSKELNLFVFNRSEKALLPKVVRYLQKNEPDILISTLQFVNIIAALAGKLSRSKTKVVLREANSPVHKLKYAKDWKRKLIYGTLSKSFYPFADGFISVSNGLKIEMEKFYKVDPKKIKAIHNPVVTASIFELAKAPVSHPWLEQDFPLIVAAGRMHPQKDYVTLLKAFLLVRKTRLCKLLIMGDVNSDPSYYETIKQLVSSLNLEEDVNIIGFQKNPFAYLSQAKVFVLSSIFEGLPGVLIQALALGCSVVSTDCPYGPREILDNGKYGKLVPVGNYEAMAKAIEVSMLAPNNKLENEERSHAFSIEQAEKYLEFFEWIVDNPKRVF